MATQQHAASASSSSSGLHLLASPSSIREATHTKVFVGGLAWETSSDRLRRFYERFGDILEAVVITDRHSGRSKGYGFVTFREAESASKACEDPTPVIDGRRANCNLASLGRAQHPVPPGRPRSAGSYLGVPVPKAFYLGGYSHHRPFPLGYYQGFPVPQYSYPSYGTEYIYPQGTLNSYSGQQYLPIYGVSAAANTSNQAFSQLSPSVSGGGNGYLSVHSYNVPGNQYVQLTGSNFSGASPTARPSIQTSFLVGNVVPLDCSRTKKSSVAVFTAFVLAWQAIILAFIRLSLSWSTDVPGNHEVAPMDGASDPRVTVALAVSLSLNRKRDGA
ncbi:putative RNA-binding protein ARP1 [Zea mays]|uniref:Putative RNA-binding protein ARP1 n=1 Tax=Zea mays TaxID=4577 RepID=A0A3L6EJF7_MAIZE|nr:putative RNA-binding protein ARP1 [Zea mays]